MDPDDMIGATLGSYRVIAKLGQGGMGAVYLAEHPVLGRKAAVKLLLPELSRMKEAVLRFFDEARTTARLRHPALVDVFDFGSLPDGRAFLIMEYLEGECLETRIGQRGPLPVREALTIARQIALGVSVAHAEQIVHRDLKPDNIFLLPPAAGSREERVKILDFGIAKLGRTGGGGSGLTREGAIIGTPPYMAPEQGRGESEVDQRADIYSLGCILFTMLAGRPPFLSESAYELVALHQHEPPPTLESLGVTASARLERLVATMLEKTPAARFGSMMVVADAIVALIDSEAQDAVAPRTTLLMHAVSPAPGARRRSPLPNQVSGVGKVASAPAAGTPPGTPSPAPRAVTRPDPTGERASRLWSPALLAGGAAAILAAAIIALLLGRSRSSEAPPPQSAAEVVTPAPAQPPPPARASEPAQAPPPPIVKPVEVLAAPPTAAPSAIGVRPRRPEPAASAARQPPGRETDEPKAREMPPKSERPVYRGTQLEIEKKAPY